MDRGLKPQPSRDTAPALPGPPGVRARATASQAAARARRQAHALIRSEDLLRPAAHFRILPVAGVRDGSIDLGGWVLDAPALADSPGQVRAVGAAVCTLGAGAERRVSALFAAGRRSLALALDGVANQMLFRLADRVVADIARAAHTAGWTTGVEISPGDPGLALQCQPAVLALADAQHIGVTLAGSLSLSPGKSLTLLVAVGLDLPRQVSRCRACPSRQRCQLS